VALGFSHSSSLSSVVAAVGAYKARSMTSKLPAYQPLWRALSQVAASQLVPECSWQLRYAGSSSCLLLLYCMHPDLAVLSGERQ
jgi:hypothetical protein